MWYTPHYLQVTKCYHPSHAEGKQITRVKCWHDGYGIYLTDKRCRVRFPPKIIRLAKNSQGLLTKYIPMNFYSRWGQDSVWIPLEWLFWTKTFCYIWNCRKKSTLVPLVHLSPSILFSTLTSSFFPYVRLLNILSTKPHMKAIQSKIICLRRHLKHKKYCLVSLPYGRGFSPHNTHTQYTLQVHSTPSLLRPVE